MTAKENLAARDREAGAAFDEHLHKNTRLDPHPQAAKRAEIFAPIPARAMADEALSALDLRVLAALAAHDRFGANGIGCYASHKRLAALVRCHLKSLSRSLRTLAEHGYIDAAPHPLNKRTRVYRVRYTGADEAVMKERIGNEPATDNEPIGNETVPENGAIGNRDFQESEQYQGDAGENIFCEAGIYPAEAVEDTSAEAALRMKQCARAYRSGGAS